MALQTRQSTEYTFNDYDPQYKCCCGSMHVRTAAIVIGVLELLSVISYIIGLIVRKVQNKPLGLEGSVYYGVAGSVITIIVVVLSFIAIKQEHHGFVIPHLVWQMIGILGCVAGTFALNVLGSLYTFNLYVILIIFLFPLFESWVFMVILKLYRYYRDKRLAASSAPTVQYGYTTAVGPPQPNYGHPNVDYSKYP